MWKAILVGGLALLGSLQTSGSAAALSPEQENMLVAAVAAGTARQAVGDLLAATQPDTGQLPGQVCDAVTVMLGAATEPAQRAQIPLDATEAASAYMQEAGFPEAARVPVLITIQEQCVLRDAARSPDSAQRLLEAARDRASGDVSPAARDAAVSLFAAINAPAPPGLEEDWAALQALAQATGFTTVAQNLLVAVEPAAGPAAPAGGGLAPAPAAPGPVGGGGGGGGGAAVASPS